MAMPWSRAKAKRAAIIADTTGKMRADLTRLFNACFRIQREACAAAGRHIPMVVENVRGANEWVGRSRFNYGSFHLWGDVPALMPQGRAIKVKSFPFDGNGGSFQTAAVQQAGRSPAPSLGARFTSRDCGGESRWFNDGPRSPGSISSSSSSSPKRKAASALIAKIPLPLSRHIAAVYRP